MIHNGSSYGFDSKLKYINKKFDSVPTLKIIESIQAYMKSFQKYSLYFHSHQSQTQVRIRIHNDSSKSESVRKLKRK